MIILLLYSYFQRFFFLKIYLHIKCIQFWGFLKKKYFCCIFPVNEYYCGNNPADVVFLLDSSNSIWGPHFRTQLQFVKDVVSMFQVDVNQTRIGIVTYGSSVRREFYLNEFPTKRGVLSAIDRIRQMQGYATHTHSAIKFMRETMFTTEKGARDDVARVGIILTDGQSSNMLLTVWEASRAKKDNVNIFAIGIGSKINTRELRLMASRPSHEHFFKVTDFNALQNIKDMLAVRTCRGKVSSTISVCQVFYKYMYLYLGNKLLKQKYV